MSKEPAIFQISTKRQKFWNKNDCGQTGKAKGHSRQFLPNWSPIDREPICSVLGHGCQLPSREWIRREGFVNLVLCPLQQILHNPVFAPVDEIVVLFVSTDCSWTNLRIGGGLFDILELL